MEVYTSTDFMRWDMKVYVVTSGEYSDYMINKIFLDKDKAEEYRKWLPDSNDIEEYDTSDEDVMIKQYVVRVELKLYPNKKEDLIARVWKNCESNFNYNCYYNYNDIWDELVVTRTVSGENFDKEFWKDKLTKHIYDLKAYVEYLKVEGFDEKQIREAIALK
jgi:hypothetical protein